MSKLPTGRSSRDLWHGYAFVAHLARSGQWELVGTHTGLRTFIVNALSLGIPPNVVMKWTGHNDYKAMKPYIDIVDSIKASEMTKLNGLI